MNARTALTLILALSAAPAFAAMPRPEVAAQVRSAQNALEQKVGFRLTDQQSQDLADNAQADRPDWNSKTIGSKAIYCLAVRYNAIVGVLSGSCVNVWTGNTYDIAFVGGGVAFQLVGSFIRLRIDYDTARYATDFDPIPGRYGLVTDGGALVIGSTHFEGDSGNKRILGGSINVGLGIDLFTFDYLEIER